MEDLGASTSYGGHRRLGDAVSGDRLLAESAVLQQAERTVSCGKSRGFELSLFSKKLPEADPDSGTMSPEGHLIEVYHCDRSSQQAFGQPFFLPAVPDSVERLLKGFNRKENWLLKSFKVSGWLRGAWGEGWQLQEQVQGQAGGP